MSFNEIFYFEPEMHSIDKNDVGEVILIGEFNNWGKDKTKLKNYKLLKDNTGRWVGLFNVPQGIFPYKFLVNAKDYYPLAGLFYYSTTNTAKWAKNSIWYQIIPDRFNKSSQDNPVFNLIDWDKPPTYFDNFGGDFRGIIEKIDYLKDLFGGSLEGVGFYFTPIQKSIASNHKYWIEDFTQIDPQFGTEEDFKELLDSIHKNGGKLIIDTVYNHSGLNHYAFIDCLQNGPDSKYWNWYRHLANYPEEKILIPILEDFSGEGYKNIVIDNDPRNPEFNAEKQSFFSIWNNKYRFPISNPENFKNANIDEIINGQKYYKLTKLHSPASYACWWGLFELPELNAENPSLQEHLFFAAKKFIKMGIDGFRLDVPDTLNNAHSFWEKFRQEMKEELKNIGKNPDELYITGEIWTNDNLTSSFLYPDKNGEPIRFDSIMNYPVREAVFNFLSDDLLKNKFDEIEKKGEISVTQLDNALHHNIGHISWGIDTAQMNIFSSHDTRRVRTALGLDTRLFSALTLQFTFPGAPVIYYGDELGMYGGSDPGSRATIKWNKIDKEEKITNFYKKLIKIRKENSVLINGAVYTLFRDDLRKIYSYARYDNNNCIITVISKEGLASGVNIDISHMPFSSVKKWKNLLTDETYYTENKAIIIKTCSLFSAILTPIE